jgi:crotonobetainyl-CoA:carnitine CoA-transferase CaiB-like acyl-CoA transferase
MLRSTALARFSQPTAASADTLVGGIAPYQTYATKDGKAMSLAALEPKFWMAFSQASATPSTSAISSPGRIRSP